MSVQDGSIRPAMQAGCRHDIVTFMPPRLCLDEED